MINKACGQLHQLEKAILFHALAALFGCAGVLCGYRDQVEQLLGDAKRAGLFILGPHAVHSPAS